MTLNKIKETLLKLFRRHNYDCEINVHEELKRNRLIKKMRSNAIAITTKQIEIHEGTMKMKSLISAINRIKKLENSFDAFENYYNEFQYFPINEEQELYNKDFLVTLNSELSLIDERYKPLILKQCEEIIDIFDYIKNVC